VLHGHRGTDRGFYGYRRTIGYPLDNDLDDRLPGIRARITRIGDPPRSEGIGAVDFEELGSSIHAMTHILIWVVHNI
jgi:hypothetical protein